VAREGVAIRPLSRFPDLLRIFHREDVMDVKTRLIAAVCAGVLVTAADARAQIGGDPVSISYARLGYGAVFGDRAYPAPAVGFGYRAEDEAFAVDVSFLNLQLPSETEDPALRGMSGSFLKLQGLRYVNFGAHGSAYAGGGFSYGFADFGGGSSGPAFYESSWHGRGLQLEATIGYETPRSIPMRIFVEANATLPLYNVSSELTTYTKSYPYSTSVSTHRYAPSVVVSVGVGWDRSRLP
jgi:hypothetical protein